MNSGLLRIVPNRLRRWTGRQNLYSPFTRLPSKGVNALSSFSLGSPRRERRGYAGTRDSVARKLVEPSPRGCLLIGKVCHGWYLFTYEHDEHFASGGAEGIRQLAGFRGRLYQQQRIHTRAFTEREGSHASSGNAPRRGGLTA